MPQTVPSQADESQPAQSFDSRYDQPTQATPVPTATAPLGHAVAVVGYDMSYPDKPQLAWEDPANNIVDGKGVHRWAPKPKFRDVHVMPRGLGIQVDDRRASVFAMVVVESTIDPAAPPPARACEAEMPDLSQHAGPHWQNLCGPTSAADVIYALRHEDAGLRARLPTGPGGLADTAADQCIAGMVAPPARAGSLAQLMQWSDTAGTSAEHLTQGLRTYLQNNAEHPEAWRVRYVAIDTLPKPAAALDLIQQTVSQNGGVILAINWGDDEQPPTHQLQSPNHGALPNAKASTNESVSKDTSDAKAASRNPMGPGQHRGSHPAPPLTNPPIDTSLPAGPEDVDLPAIQGVAQTRAATSSNTTTPPGQVDGWWEQVKGSHSADFAVGGYVDGELRFGRDGTLLVRRHFGIDGRIIVTQRFTYEVINNHTLAIKPMGEHDELQPKAAPDSGLMTTMIDEWGAQRPVVKLPGHVSFSIEGGQLRLMDRTYRRKP